MGKPVVETWQWVEPAITRREAYENSQGSRRKLAGKPAKIRRQTSEFSPGDQRKFARIPTKIRPETSENSLGHVRKFRWVPGGAKIAPGRAIQKCRLIKGGFAPLCSAQCRIKMVGEAAGKCRFCHGGAGILMSMCGVKFFHYFRQIMGAKRKRPP